MVKEKDPGKKEAKEKIKAGDSVRFVSEAPEQMFPPFNRGEVYIAQTDQKYGLVDLISPATGNVISIRTKYLQKVGDEGTLH